MGPLANEALCLSTPKSGTGKNRYLVPHQIIHVQLVFNWLTVYFQEMEGSNNIQIEIE
jgi:hypothetical protein